MSFTMVHWVQQETQYFVKDMDWLILIFNDQAMLLLYIININI